MADFGAFFTAVFFIIFPIEEEFGRNLFLV
jgi:hypothetical protein